MSDYISREAAIAYIREQSEEMGKAFEELGGESFVGAMSCHGVEGETEKIELLEQVDWR